MPPALWLSGRSFECAVERIEPAPDGWIVKTTARRFFRLDTASHALLRRIMAARPGELEDPAFAIEAGFLKRRLVPLGIYRPVDTPPGDGRAPTRGAMRWHRQLLPAHRVRPLAAALAALLTPKWLVPLILLCAWLHASFIAAAPALGYVDLVTCSPGELLLFIGVAAARGLLHEFGHAAACWRLTRSVGAIGFGVFITAPVLYCDVSDVHLLTRRRKALVGMAGPLMDFAFLAVLVGVGGASVTVAKVYWLNVAALVLNLLPFYRNDGFWILNDLAGSDDLVKDSFRACRRGTARFVHWLMAAFTIGCAGGVIALAAAFAVDFGPRQVVDAARLLPAPAGAALALVTSLQYAALLFGVASGCGALRRRIGRSLRAR